MKLFKVLPPIIVAAFLFGTSVFALDVIPSGKCVGIKLYTDGLVVVDTEPVIANNGKSYSPASELKSGDIIKSVNGRTISSIQALADEIQSNGSSSITLTLSDNKTVRDVILTPVQTSDGFRLGVWLRDSTAGLGTITFTTNNSFAALGHGICDIDTGNIIPVGHGIIQDCTIKEIAPGSNGVPGAITGSIDGNELGTVTANTELGLFGSLDVPVNGATMEVASRKEVRTGDAYILADVDGNGVRRYSVEIKRVSPPLFGTKDMVIKITDPSLIEKTGGIVQGMSGAPIIQNNKLVGAITHVFVNDSLSGYAVLAERMSLLQN